MTANQTAKPRHRVRKASLIVIGASIIGGIAISASGGSSHATPVAPQVTHSAPAAPASHAPKAAPVKPAKPAKPAAPAITVSQQQALDSAKSYLDMGGFSRDGLIQQLSSHAGEKFPLADATWAVDHSGADWNAQAVLSAKSYMEMGGFSRASLIDQLTSHAGEQFTLAQATYAANHVGL